MNPQSQPLHILLADDDIDDCFFFAKALKELPIETQLTTVHDGEELMHYLLKNSNDLPEILFLDLSMPRKTGFECLTEIKENELLKDLSVIMFSTSFTRDTNYENGMISTLRDLGANDYIRKPGDFELLKQIVNKALIDAIEKRTKKLNA